MPCKTICNEELARAIPVNTPTVKRKMNPSAHGIAGGHLVFLPCNVANWLNTFTPVATVVITVTGKMCLCGSVPPYYKYVVSYTINPKKPIVIMAHTILI